MTAGATHFDGRVFWKRDGDDWYGHTGAAWLYVCTEADIWRLARTPAPLNHTTEETG